jgi:hypothetical protein
MTGKEHRLNMKRARLTRALNSHRRHTPSPAETATSEILFLAGEMIGWAMCAFATVWLIAGLALLVGCSL